MAVRCAAVVNGIVCDVAKAHAVHVLALGLPGAHPFLDARGAAKLRPQSEARTEYLASPEHKAAYGALANAERCLAGVAGAPGECFGDLTPHHVAGRGGSGGQRAAERRAPVIVICATHNTAIEHDPQTRAWAERTYFERDGVEWPFRLTNTSKRSKANR